EVVYDSKTDDTVWSYLDVNAIYNNNSDIIISAGAANTHSDVTSVPLQTVNDNLSGLKGRYIRLNVKIKASADGKSSKIDYIEIGGNTEKQAGQKTETIEKVSISGTTQVIKNAEYTYRVNTQSNSRINSDCQWFIDGVKLSSKGNQLSYRFDNEGIHTLKAGFDTDGDGIVEYSDKVKITVSEPQVTVSLNDMSLIYPVFNINLDKTGYVAGDTVYVTTDIDKENTTATVTYDGNVYNVSDISSFVIPSVTQGNHTLSICAEGNGGNTFRRQTEFKVYESKPDVKTWYDSKRYFEGDDVTLSVEDGYIITSCTSDHSVTAVTIAATGNSVLFIKPETGLHTLSLTVEKEVTGEVTTVQLFLFINDALILTDPDSIKAYGEISGVTLSENGKELITDCRIHISDNIAKYILSYKNVNDDKLTELATETYVTKGKKTYVIKSDTLETGRYELYLYIEDIWGNNCTHSYIFDYTKADNKADVTEGADITEAIELTDVNISQDGSSVNVYVKVNANESLKEYILEYAKAGEDTYKEIACVTAIRSGEFVYHISADELSDEEYLLRLIAADIYGNSCTYSAMWQYTKAVTDVNVTKQRDISGMSEISGATISEDGTKLNIDITVYDNTDLSEYVLGYRKSGQETYTEIVRESDITEGTKTYGLNTQNLTEGVYELQLYVEDTYGNSCLYNTTLEYVKAKDTTELTHKGEVSDTIKISGISVSDDDSKLEVYIDISDTHNIKEYVLDYVCAGSTTYTEIVRITDIRAGKICHTISAESLATGEYELRLTAKDVYDNICTYTASLKYEKVKATTAVSESIQTSDIIELSGVNTVAESSDLEVHVNVKEAGRLKAYVLEYAQAYSDIYTELVSTETIQSGACSYIISEDKLSDGEYIIRLTAKDMYGNTGTSTMNIQYTKAKEALDVTAQTDVWSMADITDIKLSDDESELSIDIWVKEASRLKEYIISYVKCGQTDYREVARVTDAEAGVSAYNISTDDLAAGRYEVKLDIVDIYGNVATRTWEFDYTEGTKNITTTESYVTENTDKTHPMAGFTSPDSGEILNAPTEIKGFAYDETKLDYYRLEYRMSGESEYQLIAESTQPVKDGTLGTLDTTLLMNGEYEIRLTAVDKAGNRNRVVRKYVVEGNLKLGNMNIGFTDIVASIAGTTINVNRQYDSRNKHMGDFGYGWTLGISGMTLTESNPIYKGYEMVQVGSVTSLGYELTETISHDVIVTYGDGTSDRFEMTFDPTRSALVPITTVTIGFRCVTNPDVKLQIAGNARATVLNSYTLLFEDESIYDKVNYVLTDENGNRYYLDAGNGVTKIVTANGNEVKVTDDGYIASNGKSVRFTRNSDGLITGASDPYGHALTYTYDDDKNLVAVTDEAGRTVRFTYDDKHNLIEIIDPLGIATARNEYDESGRLTALVDADGNRVEYTYDCEGRSQTVKDRRGNTSVYVYDENGNTIQVTDAYGNVTKSTYNEENQVMSTTDALGRTTTYSYDDKGNLIKVTAPDGKVSECVYTQENYISGIRMHNKTQIAYTYDNKGRVTGLTDALGNTTSFAYTADGNVESITDSIGIYYTATYDEKGRVTSTVNGEGEKADYTYDDKGNCTSVTVSREENGENVTFTTYYTYDTAGNIIQSIDNAGNAVTYEYDANDNITATVDAKGRRISYGYDKYGNLVKVMYPDGTYETFTYDANGNNLTATDRNGLTVKMEYDKLDRLIKYTYADGTYETYEYDAVSNLIATTTVTGVRTTYTYDECNRNTAIIEDNGNTYTFAYDEYGRLKSRRDVLSNTVSYEYDANGNVIKVTYPDGNSVSAEYDARNRVVSQTDRYGRKTTYSYDKADRLTAVTDVLGNSYTYGYDANGNLRTVTDANSNITAYTYDAVGRVESITNPLGKKLSYKYDSTGNVVSYTDYAGQEWTYTYDEYDNLISLKTADNTITYTYDDKHRLTKVCDNSGTVSYTYDNYNRVTSVTDAAGNMVSYTYDEYGRLKTVEALGNKTEYEYDKYSRLVSVTDGKGNKTTYEYDILGNRSAVTYSNGVKTTYTYDSCQRLIKETVTDKAGKLIAEYKYTLGKAGERVRVEESSYDSTSDGDG
ncbi:MAG: RHS repeat protein, partial [Lachnospira sp.]|nr:RHS repeat protein [Lachnospira sp.]